MEINRADVFSPATVEREATLSSWFTIFHPHKVPELILLFDSSLLFANREKFLSIVRIGICIPSRYRAVKISCKSEATQTTTTTTPVYSSLEFRNQETSFRQ